MEMEKILMGGMAALIGLAAVASVAQASTPRLDYVCPIDGLRFATYEELYQHFITEHPAEPIEIIWE
jgi:hypothetical protein